MEEIVWDTTVETEIVWGDPPNGETAAMYQHPKKVRKNNTIRLRYTFRDAAGEPISLAGYASVWLMAKCDGQEGTTVLATVDAPTLGKVSCLHKFDSFGVWNLQFRADHTLAVLEQNGDPAHVEVVNNVSDLAAADAPLQQ
jgi:hypothetical protein